MAGDRLPSGGARDGSSWFSKDKSEESHLQPVPLQTRRMEVEVRLGSSCVFSCELAMNYAKGTIKLLDRSLRHQSSQCAAIAHNELKQRDVFSRHVQARSQRQGSVATQKEQRYQSRWSCWEPVKRHLTASCLSFPTTHTHCVGMGSIPEF